MTRLECTVASCVHNSEKCCCKQGILVEGVNARESCDTCCGSFEENRGGLFKNLFKTPETSAVQRGSRSWETEPGLLGRRSAVASENGRKRKGRRGFCRRPGTRAPRRFGRVLFLKKYLNKVH